MKKILIQLEADAQASAFDQIAAYDAGVDQILTYPNMKPEDVATQIYGAMFSRGREQLKNTAVFVGGTHVPTAERLWERVQKTFFGELRVSVMFDANGCNTTASALVSKIASGRNLKGKKALVLAGTGPVGIRAATLLYQEGCEVYVSSRKLERASEVCRQLKEQVGVEAAPVQFRKPADLEEISRQVQILASCGAPGVRLLAQESRRSMESLELAADINAVEPLGLGGLEVMDDGQEREGKFFYGALAIGNLKMKIHHQALRMLFAGNDQNMDLQAIYALTKRLQV